MNTKTLGVGFLSLALVGLAALAYILLKPVTFRGTSYAEPFPRAPEIELKTASGQAFQLSAQKDKIVLLFFGYTSCPDVCPTTLAELNQVMLELGHKKDRVQVVFISVDPKRDTPQKIQEYVQHFNPAFLGLTGSPEILQVIWDNYGVFREEVESDSAFGYIVNHTARTFLIDPAGNLRLSYGFQAPVSDIVHDLEILLR